ncbi:MAG: Rid family hydrolase, partial [Dehalococcoidia bacterium]
MPRERVAPISPYESIGYSRALRVGNLVFVAGTAAIDAEGKNVAVGDAYGQAKRCFEVIEASLQQVGAAMSDVVRTRIFLA